MALAAKLACTIAEMREVFDMTADCATDVLLRSATDALVRREGAVLAAERLRSMADEIAHTKAH
jgi:hypothetical protein